MTERVYDRIPGSRRFREHHGYLGRVGSHEVRITVDPQLGDQRVRKPSRDEHHHAHSHYLGDLQFLVDMLGFEPASIVAHGGHVTFVLQHRDHDTQIAEQDDHHGEEESESEETVVERDVLRCPGQVVERAAHSEALWNVAPPAEHRRSGPD